MIHTCSTYLSKIDARLWAVTISLIISFILGCNFYISADGILYLHTAEALLTPNALMPPVSAQWPFYPFMIATLAKITGITVQNSALILQAGFLALLIVSFVNIVRILGGNRLVQHLAALVILLHPDLNDNRHLIIRDFGYLAFLFTSLYYLLRYLDYPTWLNAFFWTGCMTVATLFRIEGVVIAAFAPLLILHLPKASILVKITHMARFYGLWMILIVAGLSLLFWQQHEISWSALGRINELPAWWHHLTNALVSHWENVRDTINLLFPHMKNPHVNIFLLGGLTTYIVYRLINTIGLVFFVLVLYGQLRQCLTQVQATYKRRVIYGFLLINVLIIVVFVSQHWFVSTRYLSAISIVLLLWLPFTLSYIYQRWQHTTYYLRFPRLTQFLLCCIIAGLFVSTYISFGPSHVFVRQSATWIQQHVPENATLYTNNAPLAYYAARPGTDWYANHPITPLHEVLTNKSWQHFDYVAFYINRNDKKTLQAVTSLFSILPLKKFSNARGDVIMIYQVKTA